MAAVRRTMIVRPLSAVALRTEQQMGQRSPTATIGLRMDSTGAATIVAASDRFRGGSP